MYGYPQEKEENVLEKYGRDIVEDAKAGKIDPVIGRDEEIRSITRILSRKTKNNPVLIGEPGVGKTAITGQAGTIFIFLKACAENQLSLMIWSNVLTLSRIINSGTCHPATDRN